MRWIPRALAALLFVSLVACPVKADQKTKEAKEAEKTFEAAQEAAQSEPGREAQGEEQAPGTEAKKSPMAFWKDLEKKLLDKNAPPGKGPEPAPGSDLRQIRRPFR